MKNTNSSGKINTLCSFVAAAMPQRMLPQTGWSSISRYSPQSVRAANIASHCAQQPAFSSIVGASTQASIPMTAAPGFAPRFAARFKTASAASV